MMYDEILNIIQTNEFFQGGFLVALVSAMFMYVRSIPKRLYYFYNRYTTLYFSLPDSTPEFNWLSQYVNDLYKDSNYGEYTVINRKGYCYTSIGDHRYYRISRLCWVKFIFTSRELDSKAGGDDALAYSTSLKFYGLGKRAALQELLTTSKKLYGPKKERRSVKRWDDGWWQTLCDVPSRTMETVYSDAMSFVYDDIQKFYGQRETYEQKGIPFRRGFLLHGPPGTGKTSSISALANELDLDICLVNLTTTSGSSLMSALSSDDKLFVFEDIDGISSARARAEKPEDEEDELFKQMSISELLNAIDGQLTGQNLIFFFTTNHPDKLDAALMRPGRIDQKVLFGYMNQSEFEQMVYKYFGRDCEGSVRPGLTAAVAQNSFLIHRDYDKFMLDCAIT